MKAVQSAIKYLIIFALFYSTALAQSPDSKTQSFAKDGLSFEYAAGWNLTDKSTSEAQHLILTREGSSVLIMIIVYRDLIGLPEQLAEARRNITEPFIEDTIKRLGASGFQVERKPSQTKVGDEVVDGARLLGMVNKEKSTAEIYSFLRKLRFVNLVYIRADKDSSPGDMVWDVIRRTLKLDTPIVGAKEGGGRDQKFPDQHLNGRALRLPQPGYPKLARESKVSGTVVVQVLIDEEGNVVAAHAISGHPLLVPEAERVARLAKFTPTRIYNEPVRVTGVITYNFLY